MTAQSRNHVPHGSWQRESHAAYMSIDQPLFCVPTVSGELVDILDPHADQIHLMDIAVGLSNTCRYAGQIQQYYSVAQHSVVVSRMVGRRLAPYGLLHDAAEAYLHDLGPAVKLMVGSLYRPIEDRLQELIYRSLGLRRLSADDRMTLKDADQRAAKAEMEFFGICGRTGAGKAHHDADLVVPLGPGRARALFLDRFNELFV